MTKGVPSERLPNDLTLNGGVGAARVVAGCTVEAPAEPLIGTPNPITMSAMARTVAPCLGNRSGRAGALLSVLHPEATAAEYR